MHFIIYPFSIVLIIIKNESAISIFHIVGPVSNIVIPITVVIELFAVSLFFTIFPITYIDKLPLRS